METRALLDKIMDSLDAKRTRGVKGNLSSVARLMGVSPSTVFRWHEGKSEPHPDQRQSLNLLYKILYESDQNNPQAKRILNSILDSASSLLAMGLGGILIAAGLEWLFKGINDE